MVVQDGEEFMSLFSWLRTSEKAVDTGLDLVTTAAKGLDMLVFTDEEKAQMSLSTMKLWLEMQDRTAHESSIRSLTRRFIAISIVFTFLLFLIGAAVVFKIDVGWARYLLGLAEELGDLTLLVAFFYFGSHSVSSILKGMKK
jgi:hypothetical protein